MRFCEKQKANGKDSVWLEYCGFLDLSLEDYMYIQRSLMDEQVRHWKSSGLGRLLLGSADPADTDELRRSLPLTDYYNYAEVLLPSQTDLLPDDPVLWIQTTWEGGLHPTKYAPYSREMLDAYTKHAIAVTMLASSRRKGDYSVSNGDCMLYGGAPLPYATGLLPLLMQSELDLKWLPDDDAAGSSFSERIKTGFSMSLKSGIDFFFAIGSVANYITECFGRSLASQGGSGSPHMKVSPVIAARFLRAKYLSRRDGRPIVPADLFRTKGLVCTGTDASCYKSALAQSWGVVPVEMAAGTESTCIGVETWEHNGMVFFPDSCFYEFIPEADMLLSLKDKDYVPRTCLMDEVCTGERYELVISVLHGGAFMRYRIGDVYRCISAGGGSLPRFTFVDRRADVIDIAGFTRLTESTISDVIRLSKLSIGDWIAKKEYGANGAPLLHMYVEIPPESLISDAAGRQVLTDLFSAYFRYYDSDYGDLKKLLNMEPLNISILKYGSIRAYTERTGRSIPKINPSSLDLAEIVKSQTFAAVSKKEGKL